MRHPTHEHGSREHGADDQPVALAALFGVACGLLGVVHGGVPGARLGKLVARRGDRRLQRLDARPRGVVRHGGSLRREVHRRPLDARDRAERALDPADARGAVHAANRRNEVGRVALRHHFPRNRANTSSSSSIFCWRSLFDPVRSASATHNSMWRPSRSFSTCSRAPCTAETWSRMSTQYASPSIIRWRPCTCPSIRRRRPRTLVFVSSLIILYPLGVVSTRLSALST